VCSQLHAQECCSCNIDIASEKYSRRSALADGNPGGLPSSLATLFMLLLLPLGLRPDCRCHKCSVIVCRRHALLLTA
jgi:hypothetical protein